MREPGLKGCLLVLLVVLGTAIASENDDLVFDQDGKQTLEQTPLIESQQHDSLLHRIKRGIFDWFAPAKPTTTTTTTTSTTTTTTTTTESPPEEEEPEGNEVLENVPVEVFDDKKPKSPSNLVRETRESAEENGEAEENNEIGNAAAGRREPVKIGNTDDEDLAGSGDIEGSATSEVGRHGPPNTGNNPQRKFYRITLTIGEPYLREYADRSSREYKELSANLTQTFEDLFNRHLPGESHYANVVKISPTASDSFTSLVTLDIGSTFTDEAEVRSIIEEQLRLHSLDNIQLYPDEFFMRIFQDDREIEEECEPSTELTCKDGACVPLSARCDGIAQCNDASDEVDCPATTNNPYVETEEPEEETTAREDEDENFDDDTSERTATNKCRADDTVRCSDGSHYICSVQQCDGVPDCNDGADEIGCNQTGCSAGEFACDVSRCILESERCNFVEDCRDGSDEHDCNYPACSPSQFKCRNGQCIDYEKYCNGVKDCHDESDERNCLTTCSGDQFRCTDGTCLNINKRCDSVQDCRNGEDELQCGCGEGEFQCADGLCIGYELQCNGMEECLDGSDERDCGLAPCPSMDFTCSDGSCISKGAVCDGFDDCPMAEDELHCARECTPTQFKCLTGNKCIEGVYRCDGHPDCPDHSDEDCANKNITHITELTKCPNGQRQCDNGVCINKDFFCDNNRDCHDGSDERDCPEAGGSGKDPVRERCQPDEFSCRDGSCIPHYAICDNRVDCPDGDDESNCPRGRNADRTSSGGHPDSLTYENQAGKGQKQDYQPLANLSTRRSCAPDDFVCADGTCIPENQHCDQFYDCRDFTDEQYCFG